MRFQRINSNQLGLVFRRGRYERFVREGITYLRADESIRMLTGIEPLMLTQEEFSDLKLDLEITNYAEMLTVGDNEIVLFYVNDIFQKVLFVTGNYLFLKRLVKMDFRRIDTSVVEIPENISTKVLSRHELTPFVRNCVVEAYEKGVLLIDGKLSAILEPGTHYFIRNEIPVLMQKVDTRRSQLEVSGQEILTQDKVMLRLNAFAQYRVTDVLKALVENRNFEKQLYVQIQLILREFIGALTLDQLLENKENIASAVISELKSRGEALGVEVGDFGIRDIILPGEVRDIMNKVLVAEKQAQANTILRREETASMRSTLNTAKLLEENPMLLRLKELEFVERIAEKISSINLSGNTGVAEQLKALFTPGK